MYGFNNQKDFEPLIGKKVVGVVIYEFQTQIKLENSTNLSIEGETTITKDGGDALISDLKGTTITECSIISTEILKIIFTNDAGNVLSLKIHDNEQYESLGVTFLDGGQVIV